MRVLCLLFLLPLATAMLHVKNGQSEQACVAEDLKHRAQLQNKLADLCEDMCKEVGSYPKCSACPSFVPPDPTPGVMTWEELLTHMDNLSAWGKDELKAWGKQATAALQVSGPYDDPCPFGYGTNCQTGNISPAQRDQVAKLLTGILSNLESKKALAQEASKVTKVVLPVETPTMPKEVKHEMESLIARMQKSSKVKDAKVRMALVRVLDPSNCSAGSAYFGACGGSSGPIDSATKAQVASILEGILGNLQSQH